MLKFANTNQALQHLANITGKKIKIAWDDQWGYMDDSNRNTTKEEG